MVESPLYCLYCNKIILPVAHSQRQAGNPVFGPPRPPDEGSIQAIFDKWFRLERLQQAGDEAAMAEGDVLTGCMEVSAS